MSDFNRYINEQGFLTKDGDDLVYGLLLEMDAIRDKMQPVSDQQLLILNSVLLKAANDRCFQWRAAVKTQ
jgi:hypothetical protein